MKSYSLVVRMDNFSVFEALTRLLLVVLYGNHDRKALGCSIFTACCACCGLGEGPGTGKPDVAAGLDRTL